MTEIPFTIILVDFFIISVTGFTVFILCPLLIEILDWKYNPSARSAFLLFVGLLTPLTVTWIILKWMGYA